MEKTERIGNIVLDYTYYPGEDYYCDGAIEDELLAIVREHTDQDYTDIIEEKGSWPVFYHLSKLRGNIVDWIPLNKTDRVLEVGSGCGAITGTLAEKAGTVHCIDLSKKRSTINAYRNSHFDNVTIQVGNFQDIEPALSCDYDYIFLIGVFEYGKSYIGGETPYEDFLAILKQHIKKEGRIVIAIENKFGLKYWAGCKEDHLGTYFAGIEDYAAGGGVRTFTRKGLEKICEKNGVEEYSFYYPYPDYKFATCIYSDGRLPKVGELSANLCNYDRERLLLFDEKNAFDGIIREELFPLYANSYLLLIGPKLPVHYTKYSNDRAKEFAIRTEICEQDGQLRVYKKAASKEAQKHILGIAQAYDRLCERYVNSSLSVNRCKLRQETGSTEWQIELEYLEGRTLEELLDDCLDRADEQGFRQLFEEYRQAVVSGDDASVIDYDLIFSNLMIREGQWTILDYEWTLSDYPAVFGKEITMQDIILRALYCYMIGAWKRRKLSLELIYEICETKNQDSIGKRDGENLAAWQEQILQQIVQQEMVFQQYVTGQRMSLTEIRNRIGNEILPVQQMALNYAAVQNKRQVQIYVDKGNGFSEENSFFVQHKALAGNALEQQGNFRLELTLDEDVQTIRIDPAMEPCILTLHAMKLGTKEQGHTVLLSDKRCKLNGNLISENTVIFATDDPNMTIEISDKSRQRRGPVCLCAEFELVPVSMAMAQSVRRTSNTAKRCFTRSKGGFAKKF